MKITAKKLADNLEKQFMAGPVEKTIVKLNKLSEAELRRIFHEAESTADSEKSSVTRLFTLAVAGAAASILEDKFQIRIQTESKSIAE
jgi:hypothetical protein